MYVILPSWPSEPDSGRSATQIIIIHHGQEGENVRGTRSLNKRVGFRKISQWWWTTEQFWNLEILGVSFFSKIYVAKLRPSHIPASWPGLVITPISPAATHPTRLIVNQAYGLLLSISRNKYLCFTNSNEITLLLSEVKLFLTNQAKHSPIS